jgi:hypothetical protein
VAPLDAAPKQTRPRTRPLQSPRGRRLPPRYSPLPQRPRRPPLPRRAPGQGQRVLPAARPEDHFDADRQVFQFYLPPGNSKRLGFETVAFPDVFPWLHRNKPLLRPDACYLYLRELIDAALPPLKTSLRLARGLALGKLEALQDPHPGNNDPGALPEAPKGSSTPRPAVPPHAAYAAATDTYTFPTRDLLGANHLHGYHEAYRFLREKRGLNPTAACSYLDDLRGPTAGNPSSPALPDALPPSKFAGSPEDRFDPATKKWVLHGASGTTTYRTADRKKAGTFLRRHTNVAYPEHHLAYLEDLATAPRANPAADYYENGRYVLQRLHEGPGHHTPATFRVAGNAARWLTKNRGLTPAQATLHLHRLKTAQTAPRANFTPTQKTGTPTAAPAKPKKRPRKTSTRRNPPGAVPKK